MASDIIFRTIEVIPYDRNMLARYPQVEYSDDDSRRPIELKWVFKDANTDATSEKVAKVFGKEIRRFVFWQKGGQKDGDGILCTWLGFETPTSSGGRGFRPFLVFEGDDQVHEWESFASYDEEDKFTVKLVIHLKGNGVYWQTSTIQIQYQGPAPLRQESGGRHTDVPDVIPYRPANAR